jgi:ribosome-binding ATPase YchF (GTP1/OBG family)
VIHTDFEKDLFVPVIATKTFSTVQKQNVKKQESSVEGKEYVVKDGDVMHFRFNV